MTLNKKCTMCKTELTTKNVTAKGRQELGTVVLLLVNCDKCKSTVSVSKTKRGKSE